MSKELKLCKACEDSFDWRDDVIVVDDDYYHKNCVELYPIGYIAMLDDQPLGETENDDGTMAFEVLEEGEYVDE
jgi:hypothetical protein